MSVFAQYLPSGTMLEFAGYVGGTVAAPAGFLLCDGSSVSRTTYAALFNAISPVVGTFTVTIATPAVVTLTGHGLQTGDQVYLTTTGTLPTGLSANTLYYAIRIDANTFNLATSRANAYAATKIATSGTQSGTHTLIACPHGLGDGSTTFTLPDSRGRALVGNDSMNGTAAGRISLATTNGVYGNLGATGGNEFHQLVTGEMPAHNHAFFSSNTAQGATTVANRFAGASGGTDNSSGVIGNTGSGSSHNNIQPTVVINHIIKT